MKRFSLLLAGLALAVFTLSSCNSGPDGVAKKWLTAFYHKDYATAKSLSTRDMEESLAQTEEMGKLPGSDTARASLDSLRNLSVEIRSTKLTSDSTADVTYVLSNDTANLRSIGLAKVNNKWLVSWSKISLENEIYNPMRDGNGGGTNPMPETPDPGTINYLDTARLEVAPQADPIDIDTSAGNMMR